MALDLTSSTGVIDVATSGSSAIDDMAVFSYVLWYLPPSASGGQIWMKGTSSLRKSLGPAGAGNDDYRFVIRHTGDDVAAETLGLARPANEWNFVVCTYGGTNDAIIYHGTLDVLATDVTNSVVGPTGSLQDELANLGIGGAYQTTNSSEIQAGSFQVYDRVLSLGEIRKLQARMQPLAGCQLYHIYGLDGTGTQRDYSGNDFDGTTTSVAQIDSSPYNVGFATGMSPTAGAGTVVALSITSITDPAITATALTIAGANFEAAQGTGGVTQAIAGNTVALTETAWADTSITATSATIESTALKYGVQTIEVTNDSASSDTDTYTATPLSGNDFVDLTSVATSGQIITTAVLAIGDQLRYEDVTTPGSHAVVVLADATFTVDGAAPDGSYTFEVRAWDTADQTWGTAADQTVVIGPIVPILTLPTEASITAATVTVGCTSDDSLGTLYFYISTSATAPSAVDLKAGTSSVTFGNDTSVNIGTNTFAATGLSASTTYYTYFIQNDGTNDSAILESGAWVTIAPVLSAATEVSLSDTTVTVTATTDSGTGTLYYYIATNATTPSAADLKAGTGAVKFGNDTSLSIGVNSFAVTGLSASTAYYTHFIQNDGTADSNIIESGVELVVNGGFDTDTGWTHDTGWSIGSGVLTADGTGDNKGTINTDTNQIITGLSYHTVFTITSFTAGSTNIRIKGDGGGGQGSNRSSAATFTETIIASSNSQDIRFQSGSSPNEFDGSIDNTSVKEMWTTLAVPIVTRDDSSIHIGIKIGL